MTLHKIYYISQWYQTVTSGHRTPDDPQTQVSKLRASSQPLGDSRGNKDQSSDGYHPELGCPTWMVLPTCLVLVTRGSSEKFEDCSKLWVPLRYEFKVKF